MPGKQAEAEDRVGDSLVRAIRDQRKTDPYIGPKIAGKEIFHRLMKGMKNERGVHAESLMCALGSLAGYACQATIRAQSIARGVHPDTGFVFARDKAGKRYFLGDELNKLVAEDKYSLWSLAAGAAQQAGAKQLPDVLEIFKHVAASVGGPDFGRPRFPPGSNAGDTPLSYVTGLWPILLPVVKKLTDDPAMWHLSYAFAIQEAITFMKTVLAPEKALTIVMESAIPMSKVDFGN